MKGTMIHPGQQLAIIPTGGYSGTTTSASTKETPKETKPAATASTSSSAGTTASSSGSAAEYHYVRSGENLASIAKKYGCSVDQLKSWNGLKNNTIYPKQKLKVSTGSSNGAADQPVASSDKKSADLPVASATGSAKNEYIYYTVKKGDNLWDIAQQYKGVSVDDIKKWNNMGSSSKLQVGQKLKINKNG
jgi:LysM repeat protein